MLNYFCCCNLTIATRIIGCLLVALSVIMINFLIYDRNTTKYDSTNFMIIFFGFDWRSYYEPSFQYNGEIFYFIIVIKIVFNMLTNFLLIFATIMESKFYTIPWMIWNFFLIAMKLVSFIIHLARNDEAILYISSSSVYLVVLLWWWIVVIGTILKWKKNQNLNVTLVNATLMDRDMSVFDSPVPYVCNINYSEV